MTHGLELTEFQIGGIIYCWKAKVKQKIIAQVIGCSEAIVCNIINRYKKAHEATVRPRTGAPTKKSITAEIYCNLIETIPRRN